MTVIRFIPFLIAATFACGGSSKPSTGPQPSSERVLVNVDAEGVGLGGHDPVSYATDSAAVAGTAEHASKHGGATYRFASADHKKTFDADMAKHAPQYGGYCAYAASMGRLSPSDPKVFQVMDGQLLVFTNEEFKTDFNKDAAGNKQKADASWPKLVAEHGKPASN